MILALLCEVRWKSAIGSGIRVELSSASRKQVAELFQSWTLLPSALALSPRWEGNRCSSCGRLHQVLWRYKICPFSYGGGVGEYISVDSRTCVGCCECLDSGCQTCHPLPRYRCVGLLPVEVRSTVTRRGVYAVSQTADPPILSPCAHPCFNTWRSTTAGHADRQRTNLPHPSETAVDGREGR